MSVLPSTYWSSLLLGPFSLRSSANLQMVSLLPVSPHFHPFFPLLPQCSTLQMPSLIISLQLFSIKTGLTWLSSQSPDWVFHCFSICHKPKLWDVCLSQSKQCCCLPPMALHTLSSHFGLGLPVPFVNLLPSFLAQPASPSLQGLLWFFPPHLPSFSRLKPLPLSYSFFCRPLSHASYISVSLFICMLPIILSITRADTMLFTFSPMPRI